MDGVTKKPLVASHQCGGDSPGSLKPTSCEDLVCSQFSSSLQEVFSVVFRFSPLHKSYWIFINADLIGNAACQSHNCYVLATFPKPPNIYSVIFNRPCKQYRKLTVPIVSTITEGTAWRPSQMIHVECTTVANMDVNTPSANISAPVKANLSWNRSILLRGMLTIQPACCVRSTVVNLYRWGRHSCSSGVREAVPLSFGRKVPSVAFRAKLTSYGTRSTVSGA